MRAAAAWALALAFFLLGGCIEAFEAPEPCVAPDVWTLTGPLVGEDTASRTTHGHASVLVRVANNASHDARLWLEEDLERSGAPVVNLHDPNELRAPGEAVLAIASILNSRSMEPASVYAVGVLDNPERCEPAGIARIEASFATPQPGEAVVPGAGVAVHTAGFWRDNGTLFYTNMDRVHNDTRFDRAGWYEYGGGDPLKVYVYNESREERPPRYEEAGYATTIEGFNEALKSMVTTAGAIADIPPEKAYSRPAYAGNETTDRHVLYGDALVFWIEVVEVTHVPCPVGVGPVCEAPDLPPIRA